jgi:hypothetical protein
VDDDKLDVAELGNLRRLQRQNLPRTATTKTPMITATAF